MLNKEGISESLHCQSKFLSYYTMLWVRALSHIEISLVCKLAPLFFPFDSQEVAPRTLLYSIHHVGKHF
jgi:hypothetical protein